MLRIALYIDGKRARELEASIRRVVRRVVVGAAALVVAMPVIATAAPVNVPNVFSDGDVISADEMNANFDAFATAVNDNNERLDTLESATLATSDGMIAWVGNENSGLAPSTDYNSAGGTNGITGVNGNYTVTIGNADCSGSINITHGGGTAISCRLQGGAGIQDGADCDIPVTCYNTAGSLTATGVRVLYIQ